MFTKLLPLKFTFVVNSENLDPESFITSLLSCRSFLCPVPFGNPSIDSVTYHRSSSTPLGKPRPIRSSSRLGSIFQRMEWGCGDREVGGKNFGQSFNVNSRYKRVHKQINIYYIYWKHFSFLSLFSVFVLFHYKLFNYLFLFKGDSREMQSPLIWFRL